MTGKPVKPEALTKEGNLMNPAFIQKMQRRFDALVKNVPDEEVEFWFARDLQEPLGYARWENFITAVKRAIDSCKTTGYNPDDHFRGVTKMVPLGSGAERPIDDFMLTRYACYLIAQNGDPRKEPIAFAQSYFAVQTRKQELLEDETVWLTQAMAAELYQKTPQNITLPIRAIYEEGELRSEATCKEYLQVRTEGNRSVDRCLETFKRVAWLYGRKKSIVNDIRKGSRQPKNNVEKHYRATQERFSAPFSAPGIAVCTHIFYQPYGPRA